VTQALLVLLVSVGLAHPSDVGSSAEARARLRALEGLLDEEDYAGAHAAWEELRVQHPEEAESLDFFGGRIVRRLGGRPTEWPYRAVERPLAGKMVSELGRVDYARVRLVDGRVETLAVSGASMLSSTVRADGFVVVPADLEGYPEGATVTVWLYDL